MPHYTGVVTLNLPPTSHELPDERCVYFASDTPVSCAEITAQRDEPIGFRVQLSGALYALRFRYSGIGDISPIGRRRLPSVEKGQFELLGPGATISFDVPAGACVSEFFVLIDRDRLAESLWGDDPVLRCAQHELHDRAPLRETAAITGILHGLFTRTLTGAAERVFVHGCACALFALAAAELAGPRIVVGSEFRCTEFDRAALAEARRIILENYIAPPGIDELAHRTGLNTTRLKAGFRIVYGVTVFGLVREERMKTALMLLRDHGQNVTETAYAVGYHSLSAFAAVFKKTYGFSPHEVRRNEGIKPDDRLESGRP